MAGKAKFSRRTFREAIIGSRGIKSVIAEALDCSRQTVDNYLTRWPDLVGVVAQERESLVDRAESKLMEAVDKGELKAVLFVLETMGKERGWTKRTEVTGADGAALGLSPDVMQLIGAMRLDMSDVVQAFEEMIRAQAETPTP